MLKTILLPCLIILIHDAKACPGGYTGHGGLCYFFSDVRGSWAQATQYCEIFGGKLAVIEAESEQIFLESYLNSTWNNYNRTNGIWLGGTDLLEERDWLWVKPMIPMTYTRWAPGQPSQDQGRSEDCLTILPHESFHWGDAPCETHLNFLCEVSEVIIGK